MTQIGAIRVLEDEAFLRRAARGSFAILGIALLLILAWLAIGSAIPGFPRLELERALGGWGARLMGVRAVSAWAVAGWWIALLFGCAASFVLHEVVHGFFFERFLPAGHAVSYGIDFKMGIMYASAEGGAVRARSVRCRPDRAHDRHHARGGRDRYRLRVAAMDSCHGGHPSLGVHRGLGIYPGHPCGSAYRVL